MERIVKALVFDFDGLILDTESAEYGSWKEIYSGLGCVLPFDLWAASIASDSFEPHEHLEKLAKRQLSRSEIEERRELHFERIMADMQILPGVLELVANAKAHGIRVGIASNSSHEWLDRFLVRYEISKLFEVVSSQDDVGVAKPNPAVYQSALTRLGVDASDAIAFEDSPNGVESAKRAGIFCVAVPGPVTESLSFDHADLRLKSLADMPLERLLSVFTNSAS